MRLERILIIRGDLLQESGVGVRANTNGVDFNSSVLDGLSVSDRIAALIGDTISEHNEDLGDTTGAVLENSEGGVETGVHVGGAAHLSHGSDAVDDGLLIIRERELDLSVLGELDEANVDGLLGEGHVGGEKGRELLHESEVAGGDGATAIDKEGHIDRGSTLWWLTLGAVGVEDSCRGVVDEDVAESHGGLDTDGVHDGAEHGIGLVLLGAEGPIEHGELDTPNVAGLAVDNVSAVGESDRRNGHGVHVFVKEAAPAGDLAHELIDDVAHGGVEIADVDVLGAKLVSINTVLLLVVIPEAVAVHGEGHHVILNLHISLKSLHFGGSCISTKAARQNNSNYNTIHFTKKKK